MAWILYTNPADTITWWIDTADGSSYVNSSTTSLSTWLHFAATYDKGAGNNNVNTYINLAARIPATHTGALVSSSADNFALGSITGVVAALDSALDEFRISSIARSAAWRKATYYTCMDNLVSFGSATGNIYDTRFTWDAGGNLGNRYDALTSDNETFGYDFLDRLTSVSGAYSASYAYNQIGNIASMNGDNYTYSSKPHAVTAVGPTSYTYDNNGNMLTRGSDNITWDAENRPLSMAYGANSCTFVYDGDGKRIKKTEGGQTILYVNKYYEKNLTTSENTTYYYLGDKMVAMRKGSDLSYIYQDHLSGTAPFGSCRNSLPPSFCKFGIDTVF